MMGPLRFGIPVTISCTICADNLQVLDFNCNPLLKKVETLSWLTFCETTLSFKYLEQRGNHPINLPAHLGECLALPWLSGLHLSLGHRSEHHSGRAMHSNECLVRTLLDWSSDPPRGNISIAFRFAKSLTKPTAVGSIVCGAPSVKSMGVSHNGSTWPAPVFELIMWRGGIWVWIQGNSESLLVQMFRPSFRSWLQDVCCLGMFRKHDKSHPYQRV